MTDRAPIDQVEVVDVRDGEPAEEDTVFVAVHAAGETGWYGPVSAAIGSYVHKTLAQLATGADAMLHQALHHRLSGTAMASSHPDTSWAVGAVDCAVWDLHGHLAGRPVADLLARSAARRSVPAYASWLTQELTGPVEPGVLDAVHADGWAFTKWGLRFGPQTTVSARVLAQAVERTGKAAGARIAVDAVGTWTPDLTLAFADYVSPSPLIWLEDPLPRHDLQAYGRLASAGLPVAVGERLSVHEKLQPVLNAVRPVALTLDVVGCGGITRAVGVLAASRAWAVPIYPHGRSLIPGLHLAAAFPEAVPAVEYRLQWEPSRQRLYASPLLPEHGHLHLPEAPGLGTAPRRTPCHAHP